MDPLPLNHAAGCSGFEITSRIRKLLGKLKNELSHLSQVNEIWTERQRGSAESLRFRHITYWEEWSELHEMQRHWGEVTADSLRIWLIACRARLMAGLAEACRQWTEEERRSLEWLELDPKYEERIALVDVIVGELNSS